VSIKGAGTALRVAIDWRGGLGKLPESIIEVGFMTVTFGALDGRFGGGVIGGGEDCDPTIEEAEGVF
jgi:hypothetical protein